MTYSTPRECSNSRNSLKSLLRRMVQELKQQLQPFVAGQLFVKLAISFFGLGEIAKFSYRRHFFDLRRGGGSSRAVRRRIYRVAGGRIYCHSDFSISSG